MSNRILIPYNFRAEETALISEHFSDHTDWTKTVFDPLNSSR